MTRPGLRLGLGWLGLGVASIVLIGLSVLQGASDLRLGEALGALAEALGLGSGTDPVVRTIVIDLRLPRTLTAYVIGAALGLAGAAMQAMFRNPMADPGILGVGSGAGLGAVVTITTGAAAVSLWAVPAGAAVGATLATVAIYLRATRTGRTHVTLLLLTGIALNFLLGSATALILHSAFTSQGYEVGRQVLLWTMGGLGDRTWDHLIVLLPLVLAGMAALAVNARPLDLLALGEDQAESLGVPVQRLKVQLIGATALLTAAAVAFSGVIAFVGLVVPHLVRTFTGPHHRLVLPASALGGGALLVAADLLSRTLVAPEQLPLGVVAGLVGAPFLIWMLGRRIGSGAWS
jgi:iron complex transport system permease protein